MPKMSRLEVGGRAEDFKGAKRYSGRRNEKGIERGGAVVTEKWGRRGKEVGVVVAEYVGGGVKCDRGRGNDNGCWGEGEVVAGREKGSTAVTEREEGGGGGERG
ncbi:hypothetical protein Acr_08g0012920 [Actinidia rufa]|uniref:Uncharacterized protein n=1 Tax=Actinidia rufa TaxID=165716 RepID=A0A7J0F3A9_9ERIC|nr:hypothetical protein Acr_08g0012920 [Actinidia rufa]